jgi:hypothetical protein
MLYYSMYQQDFKCFLMHSLHLSILDASSSSKCRKFVEDVNTMKYSS